MQSHSAEALPLSVPDYCQQFRRAFFITKMTIMHRQEAKLLIFLLHRIVWSSWHSERLLCFWTVHALYWQWPEKGLEEEISQISALHSRCFLFSVLHFPQSHRITQNTDHLLSSVADKRKPSGIQKPFQASGIRKKKQSLFGHQWCHKRLTWEEQKFTLKSSKSVSAGTLSFRKAK